MGEGLREVHVGLDDTDTDFQGCTTHLTFRILRRIVEELPQAVFTDYPRLVRLNPVIPFKTRGNASLSFSVKLREDSIPALRDLILGEFRNYLPEVRNAGVEPGLALLYGGIPDSLGRLYVKALSDYVHKDYVLGVVEELGDSLETPLGYSRGLVGALAAIGASRCLGTCTYELIAYRSRGNYLRERCVDAASVKAVDAEFRDSTFLNYDHVSGKPLITPSGPNPVLLGVRGEDPEQVLNAFNKLRICEDYEGWVIYKTNQAVNAHHVERSVKSFRPYQTGCVRAIVTGKPLTLPGGDVLLKLGGQDGDGVVWAVFFKETGLSDVARKLLAGDLIRVCGGSKYWEGRGLVIHSDLLEVLDLITEVRRNPLCPACGRRMKSSGSGKGWKCIKCGYRSADLSREAVKVGRDLAVRAYRPVDRAVKHLVMPEARVGRAGNCGKPLVRGWIHFTTQGM
ncbi:MAG: tRNA(Ile)(2)-agmatinylcytidine synthase [Zestosphaera sp.]